MCCGAEMIPSTVYLLSVVSAAPGQRRAVRSADKKCFYRQCMLELSTRYGSSNLIQLCWACI